MKIAVWRTGHEIADTVAEAVYEGIKKEAEARLLVIPDRSECLQSTIDEYDGHIAYGILRGTDRVFRLSDQSGKWWFTLDRGYWRPGHYEGYYRLSLRGTQQTTGLAQLEPDYERWGRLGLEVMPNLSRNDSKRTMICPPTRAVEDFYGKSLFPMVFHRMGRIDRVDPTWFTRNKESDRPLQADLDDCFDVVTFNSSVGWEALRQGIPVTSDPTHSFVGAYQKQVDPLSTMDIKNRLRMFAVQASLQLTLEEIRTGHLWPLLQKLLKSTSVMTAEKPLPLTSRLPA